MLSINRGLFWGSVELFLQKAVSDISLSQQKKCWELRGTYCASVSTSFAKNQPVSHTLGDKMKHILKSGFAACALLLLAAAPVANAQSGVVTKVNPALGTKAAGPSYWTPERFKAAKPMPMPQLKAGSDIQKQAPSAPSSGQPASSDGQAPAQELMPAGQQLFAPSADTRMMGDEINQPQATGTFGAHYSSSRVFPLYTDAAAQYSADRAYPYRTVGKLFFTIDGQPYVCSGAVIQRRVVATAGHCVHSGTSEGFWDNWVFVPAFRDGAAPFNAWNWEVAATTNTWATGGGGVPNAADYAMIVFSDQALRPGGSPARIGDVTGWLGWQTLSLIPNHTSKLGYPCNLDRCQKMQVVYSGSFRASENNNVEYGSDAGGGSSGGPWVQNFEQVPVGGGTGLNTGLNRVVGVTSYGYISTDPKVQGASIPDNRWVAVLNAVCGFGPGNCN
jgi:V8-like Glu-specific endopeptidase